MQHLGINEKLPIETKERFSEARMKLKGGKEDSLTVTYLYCSLKTTASISLLTRI